MTRMDVAPVSPAAVEALYATGHWLHARERFTDAMSVFRALLLVSPEDERGWLGLGACHEALEQEGVALELYETCATAMRAARCEIARARILRKRGLEDQARAAFDEAARLAEAEHDAILRGLALQERGR